MVEKLLNVQLFTITKSSGVLLIMTHPNSMTKANAMTILRPVSCLKTSIHPSSRLERLRLGLPISENLWDPRWGNKLCLSQNVSSLKTIEDSGVLRMTTLSNVSLLTNVIHLETWKYLIRLLLSTLIMHKLLSLVKFRMAIISLKNLILRLRLFMDLKKSVSTSRFNMKRSSQDALFYPL